MVRSPYSLEQLTTGLLDMSNKGGKLAVAWSRNGAMIAISVAP